MATAVIQNSTDRMPRTGILGAIALVVVVFGLFAWALHRAAIPAMSHDAGTETTTNQTKGSHPEGSTNVNRTATDLNHGEPKAIPGGIPTTQH